MKTKTGMKLAISIATIGLIAGMAQASLVVSVEAGSTSSTLNLKVTGTVDQVGTISPNNLYIYSLGEGWASGGLVNYLSAVTVGPSNEGPVISSSTVYNLQGDIDMFGTVGVQDVIYLDLGATATAGTVLDYTFSVRNFGIPSYDFTPLLDGGLSGQIGRDVIPEPATFGLMSIAGILFYAIRRVRRFNMPYK